MIEYDYAAGTSSIVCMNCVRYVKKYTNCSIHRMVDSRDIDSPICCLGELSVIPILELRIDKLTIYHPVAKLCNSLTSGGRIISQKIRAMVSDDFDAYLAYKYDGGRILLKNVGRGGDRES